MKFYSKYCLWNTLTEKNLHKLRKKGRNYASCFLARCTFAIFTQLHIFPCNISVRIFSSELRKATIAVFSYSFWIWESIFMQHKWYQTCYATKPTSTAFKHSTIVSPQSSFGFPPKAMSLFHISWRTIHAWSLSLEANNVAAQNNYPVLIHRTKITKNNNALWMKNSASRSDFVESRDILAPVSFLDKKQLVSR